MTTAVIFDLDDTLCDYAGARRRALERVVEAVGQHAISRSAFLELYERTEPTLFRSFADRAISLEAYRTRRFGDVMQALGAPTELSADLNRIYMQVANEEVELFDDVAETMQRLRAQGLTIAVLTNGPSDGQRKKIARCKLTDLVMHFFISEELGASKPAQACFACVAAALGAAPSELVMVGDSLTDDIEGARAAGWRGVLLDRSDKHKHLRADRIVTLRELPDMLA